MNRQAILLAAMVVTLLVFFGEPILGLFDTGASSVAVQQQTSTSKGIDDSGIRALLTSARPDSIAFTPNIWTNDFFFDRNKIIKSQFKLTGISKSESGYMAIINDEIMKKGNKMLGFTIAKISESEVRLRRNRDRITLELIE
tara:strand:+ start:1174 stop:1599 length:426 start_codon:yes stop_codon:yes gene_type:complete